MTVETPGKLGEFFPTLWPPDKLQTWEEFRYALGKVLGKFLGSFGNYAAVLGFEILIIVIHLSFS